MPEWMGRRKLREHRNRLVVTVALKVVLKHARVSLYGQPLQGLSKGHNAQQSVEDLEASAGVQVGCVRARDPTLAGRALAGHRSGGLIWGRTFPAAAVREHKAPGAPVLTSLPSSGTLLACAQQCGHFYTTYLRLSEAANRLHSNDDSTHATQIFPVGSICSTPSSACRTSSLEAPEVYRSNPGDRLVAWLWQAALEGTREENARLCAALGTLRAAMEAATRAASTHPATGIAELEAQLAAAQRSVERLTDENERLMEISNRLRAERHKLDRAAAQAGELNAQFSSEKWRRRNVVPRSLWPQMMEVTIQTGPNRGASICSSVRQLAA